MPRSPGIIDGPLGHTDLKRWRLDSTDHGRHVWSYQASSDEPELSVALRRASRTVDKDRADTAVRGKPNPLTLPQEARDYQTAEEKYWLGLETVGAASCCCISVLSCARTTRRMPLPSQIQLEIRSKLPRMDTTSSSRSRAQMDIGLANMEDLCFL